VKAIERLVGDAAIEDLWVGYVCVSANLSQARRELHRSGPLRFWLRASCSIPGLFPPVPCEGDLLVDGAVLDNLPVEAARTPTVGTVIAVDVTARQDLRANAIYERGISGWQALLGRVFPSRFTPRVPGVFQLLSRVSMLASIDRADAARATANLYLQPPVGGYGMLDWRAIEAIVESGYRYASGEVERWLRAGGLDLDA
jgi:predicted acylesterase/phospholipase RssA